MLGIASLRAGRADYYLGVVASGREDYYLGSGEAPGFWLGTHAATFELDGDVGAEMLRTLLGGDDPQTGERLARTRARRTPGFDLTFSAPKSVSILYALSRPDIARQVRDGHDRAVAATIGWLEANACAVRRGAGGAVVQTGDGFVAAAFRHRTSRAGDPHLHTHVLVANLTRGPDGQWCAPDARRLWALGNTASYLYEAALRYELTRSLGLEFGPVANGIADLVGIPRSLIETFSQRRAEILDRLDELGLDSARAAQYATFDTRSPKATFDVEELRAEWAEIAADFGVTPMTLERLTHRTRVVEPDRELAETISAGLTSAEGLTAHSSTFDRRDLIRTWCQQLPQGAPIDTIERLADETLQRIEVVELVARAAPRMRRNDGRAMTPPVLGSRYSTIELLALEQRLLEMAEQRAAGRVGMVHPRHVDRAVRLRGLNDEQSAMVTALTRAGRGVEVVVAPAGSGKTYALRAAADTWTAGGYRVIGCAVAARAARQLSNDAGIPATTIASMTDELKAQPLAPRTVLVVDEAGMAGTRTLAPLLDAATAANAKVVLVGDTRQLPEIDAGGLLRGLDHQLGAIHLRGNRRQLERWERDALGQLREGCAGRALDAYVDHERLTTAATAKKLRARLAEDYLAATQRGERALMLASRRVDVRDLNRRVRAGLVERGAFRGPVLELGGQPYQAGDRIICDRNARRLGVTNGTTAIVHAIDPRTRAMTVVTDNGDTATLPAYYLDAGHVTHGYATTIHKAQGVTVDRAFVLADDRLDRESGYTALSRGRIENRIYTVAPVNEHDHGHTLERDAVVELRRSLARSRAQELATPYRRSRVRERSAEHDIGMEL